MNLETVSKVQRQAYISNIPGESKYIVKLSTGKEICIREKNILRVPEEFENPAEQYTGNPSYLQYKEFLLGAMGRPPVDIVEITMGYLTVDRVKMNTIRVLDCSSQTTPNIFYKFHPNGTLEEGINQCWISRTGTCPGGIGAEYITYDLGRYLAIRSVSMRIPSDGPLSVRAFHLETCVSPRELDTSCNDLLIPSPAPAASAEEDSERQIQQEEKKNDNRQLHSKENTSQSEQPPKPTHEEANENLKDRIKHWKWYRVSQDFKMLRGPTSSHPIQEFIVRPPTVARFLRVVCTENMQGERESSSPSFC